WRSRPLSVQLRARGPCNDRAIRRTTSFLRQSPSRHAWCATIESMSHVPAATRALRLLRFLAARPGPVAAAVIAGELGLPRSSVYQLLEAMTAGGLVTHLPEDRTGGTGIA